MMDYSAAEIGETHATKKRQKQFDQNCFQDNSLSRGGRVKEDHQVICNLLKHKPKGPNLRCRVENFGQIVADFDHQKRTWVKDMGFEPLLALVGKGLPRLLCYWLATRVDVETEELVSLDGKRFPIVPLHVHWVLGIPIGGKDVPNEMLDESMVAEEKLLKEAFQTYTSKGANKGTKGIDGKDIEKVVAQDGVGELEFKRAFLMYVLNEVLCPTTCHRLSVKLIPAVLVFENAQEYDWCKLTMDHLMFYLRKFAKSFYSKGYAKGIGGCTFFLAVFYLDKLCRKPVDWDLNPRIEAWTKAAMIKAQHEDRLQSGDFGMLGCLDVAYGEKHPKCPREEMPNSAIKKHSTSKSSYNFYKKRTICKKPRRRKDCTSDPFGHNSKQLRKEVFEKDATNCQPIVNGASGGSLNNLYEVLFPTVETGPDADYSVTALSPNIQHPGPADDDTSFMNIGDGCSRRLNFFEGHVPLNLNVFTKSLSVPEAENDYSSTPKEKDCSSESVSEKEISYTSIEDEQDNSDSGSESSTADGPPPGFGFVTDQFEPCTPPGFGTVAPDPETRTESNWFGKRSRVQRRCRSSLKFMPGYIREWRPMNCRVNRKKIVHFVKNYECSDCSESFLIKCAEARAGVSCLRALLKEDLPLPEEYVDVAAALYTKVWEKRFVGRNKKIILPPRFASACLSDGSGSVTYHRLVQLSKLTSGQWINMLIIPVHDSDSSWWALVLSFNRREVIVMDSSRASLDCRMVSIKKLVCAVDSLLRNVVPSWKFGLIQKWPVKSVTYLTPVSSLGSGVMMLRTVKKSADRIPTVIQEGLSAKDREWLLCEDLMCEFNEERDYARRISGAK